MSTRQMSRNGLITFAFHSEDDEISQSSRPWLDKLSAALKSDEPEEMKSSEVKHWLKLLLLDSQSVRAFLPPEVPVKEPEFESVGIQKKPLTQTQKWKFRQKYYDVPVYGSQITLELDEDDELIAINSAIGGYIAKQLPRLNSDEVKDSIRKWAGNDLRDSDVILTLYYYFDSTKKDWRLVYIVESIPKKTKELLPFESTHELVDYVIDAHTGELVSKLSRMRTLQQ